MHSLLRASCLIGGGELSTTFLSALLCWVLPGILLHALIILDCGLTEVPCQHDQLACWMLKVQQEDIMFVPSSLIVPVGQPKGQSRSQNSTDACQVPS